MPPRGSGTMGSSTPSRRATSSAWRSRWRCARPCPRRGTGSFACEALRSDVLGLRAPLDPVAPHLVVDAGAVDAETLGGLALVAARQPQGLRDGQLLDLLEGQVRRDERPLVLAPHAFLERLLEVAVGGRDDADVDRDGAGAAEPLDLPLLEPAQELRLQARVHLAHLVEEKRPAVGLLEAPDAAAVGAREGALLVTEQLALQERLGHRGAVHLDQRAAAAPALRVDGVGDDLLARAAFALDED